jgi:multisubunit Na+/H+ antiporter MnhF subunit
MIAILSYLFQETSLLDVATVYAMIGFLAVVVLSKLYIMPHHTNPVSLGYENKEEDPE